MSGRVTDPDRVRRFAGFSGKVFEYEEITYVLDDRHTDADGDRWVFVGQLSCGMPVMAQTTYGGIRSSSNPEYTLSHVVDRWGRWSVTAGLPQ